MQAAGEDRDRSPISVIGGVCDELIVGSEGEILVDRVSVIGLKDSFGAIVELAIADQQPQTAGCKEVAVRTRQSLAAMASRGPGTMRCGLTSRNLASFSNIAHLHFRFARQVRERDSQLGATIILTRPLPARSIFIFCGIAYPTPVGSALPKLVLPMCCSRMLVVRVELQHRTSCRERPVPGDNRPNTPAPNPCQAFIDILYGG